jgi:hypothetical protein
MYVGLGGCFTRNVELGNKPENQLADDCEGDIDLEMHQPKVSLR